MKKHILLYLLIITHCSILMVKAQTPEIDSLENILKKHAKADTTRVNLLNKIALKLFYKDIDKVLKYVIEADSLSELINYPKGKAESIRLIGIYYHFKSDYTKALEYYQKSLQLHDELGDKSRIAIGYNNIGIIYDYQGDYPLALEYYQKSLKIHKELGDKKGIAAGLNNIGLLYNKQGNHPKALEYYQKSLQLNEELNDKSGMSDCLGNIGSIYDYQGDYPLALEYFQKSLVLDEELGDKKGIAACLNNMGIIYRKQGDFSKAYEYNLNSLEIKEELGDKRGISNCLNNTGIIYEEQGDYPKALEYFQKSLKIKQEIGDKNGISASFLNIGTAYLKTYQYAKALDYTQKALEIAIEIEHLDRLKDIHEQLSKIYAATNNYRKAYEHYVEYKQLNDSIFNEENIKRITALEYQYKYEKEKELAAAEQAEKDALQAAEAKRQQIIRNAFIGAFVLMLLIAGLIYLNLNQKRKLNRILTQQKHKVEEENVELEQQKEEIQIENYKAQLKVLQSQVDPHFLFNALNTLRSMVRHQDSNSEQFVMSLADFYRHALNHYEESTIKLAEELDVMKSYLFLMKSRNKDAVSVDLEIEEDLYEHHLPTMALQIIVENCFKHNSMSSKKPLNIDITSTEDSYIEVCNNLQPKIGEVKSSGHGLEILKKKYELLNIQDGLLIEKTPGEFCVKLKLIKT